MSNAAGAHHAYAATQAHQAPQPPPQLAADTMFQHEDGEEGDEEDEDDAGGKKGAADKKTGRRKIKIEFISDKSRRHITFSKRKAGIMKKAYELSTLTGTQVLLLVVSETGLVYTFTTAKLQPLVTQPEGKNLIQACLNSTPGQLPTGGPMGPGGASVHQASIHPGAPIPGPPPMPPSMSSRNVPGGLNIPEPGRDDDEDEDDDDLPPGGASEPPSPPSATLGGQPPTPSQTSARQSHHPRTAQSAVGAHHSAHPYGGPQNPARDAHRRGASSGGGKVTSPRLGPSSSRSALGGVGEDGGPPHPGPYPGHDPSAMYGHMPPPSPNRVMGYPGQPPPQYGNGWPPQHGHPRR